MANYSTEIKLKLKSRNIYYLLVGLTAPMLTYSNHFPRVNLNFAQEIEHSRFANENVTGDTIDDESYITDEFLMGKFQYSQHKRFMKIPKELSSKEIYIQQETLKAFEQMNRAANADGVTFIILSGTRNFSEQKKIWENKWNKYYPKYNNSKTTALKILEYSSMPSTSRHHWGTDIDINALNNEYFTNGRGKREYDWLIKNASRFGFYQTYDSKKSGRTGYSEEKWHWSYLPLAEKYLKLYNKRIQNDKITGFIGAESASEIDIIRNYVNGIATK